MYKPGSRTLLYPYAATILNFLYATALRNNYLLCLSLCKEAIQPLSFSPSCVPSFFPSAHPPSPFEVFGQDLPQTFHLFASLSPFLLHWNQTPGLEDADKYSITEPHPCPESICIVTEV